MDGETSAWYQWMHNNYPFPSWDAFVQALEERFGDSPYKSNSGALAKLLQTSSVAEYISNYEALANKTTYLPPDFLLQNFISGLKPHLRQEVQALQPTNQHTPSPMTCQTSRRKIGGLETPIKPTKCLSHTPTPSP